MAIMENHKKLFRKEALLGDIETLPDLRISDNKQNYTVAIACTLLCILTLIILTMPYTRRIEAAFIISPLRGKQQVEAPFAGILSDIYVSQGASVKQGQKLISITREQNTRNGSVSRQKQLILEDRISELENMSYQAEQDFKLKLRQLNIKASTTKLLIQNIRSQISELDQSIENLTAARDSGRRLLAENYVTEGYVRSLDVQIQSARRTLYELRANRITEMQFESEIPNLMMKYKNERAKELSHINSTLLDTKRERVDLDNQLLSYIIAERDGTVSSVLGSKGSSIKEGESLIVIEPEDKTSLVRLVITKEAAALASVDQEVTLKFDAYPFGKFGSIPASIKQIDDAVSNPEVIHRVTKLSVSEPGYLSTAVIQSNKSSEISPIELKDGLTGTASIMLETHSLIRWIIDPIIKAAQQTR